MNALEFRANFNIVNNRKCSTITYEDFKAHFKKTSESVRFTFQGWDGKSYEGQSRNTKVFRTDIPGYENIRFIYALSSIHCIEEDTMVLEEATGEYHPTVRWIIDVERAHKQG